MIGAIHVAQFLQVFFIM